MTDCGKSADRRSSRETKPDFPFAAVLSVDWRCNAGKAVNP